VYKCTNTHSDRVYSIEEKHDIRVHAMNFSTELSVLHFVMNAWCLKFALAVVSPLI
jgi:hypothetical protein